MLDFSMLHVQSSSAAANRISSDIGKILAWHCVIYWLLFVALTVVCEMKWGLKKALL